MATRLVQQPLSWKTGSGASISGYSGPLGEMVLDYTDPTAISMCIHDALTPGGVPQGGSFSAGIATPTIISPISGSLDVNPSPAFASSAFVGLVDINTADTHAASNWRIATDAGMSNIVYSLVDSATDLTTLDLSEKSVTLSRGTQYYVQVQYAGASQTLSAWSPAVSFTVKNYPITLIEKRIADNGVAGDSYGLGVCFSHDASMMFVGARGREVGGVVDAGSVYVYAMDNTGAYVKTAEITSPTPAASDAFGGAIACNYDGSMLVVGATRYDNGVTDAGGVWVFVDDGTGNYVNTDVLVSGDRAVNDYFGASVAVVDDGSEIFVAAHWDDNAEGTDAGAVYRFTNNGDNTFTQQVKFTPPEVNPGDLFGQSMCVSEDGDILVVGAIFADPSGVDKAGKVFVMQRNVSGTYDVIHTLTANDMAISDYFGVAVGIMADKSTIVVGAHGKEINGTTDAGKVYFFSGNPTDGYSQVTSMYAADYVASDLYGISVGYSGDGSALGVGAIKDDNANGTDAGILYIYN